MAIETPAVLQGAFAGIGSKVGGILSTFLWGLGIFIALGIFGWLIYNWYKNKTTYTYPVTLTVITENGMEKTKTDLKGGLFWVKGIRDFKIKAPKVRKQHILGYIPDFSRSNATDGRLCFITSGDGTVWHQYETKWVMKETVKDDKGNTFSYDLIKTPIPRETKQLTINSIKNWRETVEKGKLTAFGIAIGAFIVMVIAHLISLFIQTRIKCGVA